VNEPTRRQISSWQEAELNARDWMLAWGYADAMVTAPGSDAGIDVTATGALAQVKFEAAQVGRPQLQRLVGARARNDAQLFFFTGAGYSPQAIEYADHMHIALFRYSLDGRMTPMNPAAGYVTKRPVHGPGKVEKSAPVPGGNASGCGCLLLIAGVLLFIGFFNGLQNPANFETPSGALAAILLMFLSLAVAGGGILLLERGRKAANAAKEADGAHRKDDE
jgi:hypothetical protein